MAFNGRSALRAGASDLGEERRTRAYTAACLNNLGPLLKTEGDLGNARSFYERALAISEKAVDF